MIPLDLLRDLRTLGVVLTPYPDGTIRYKAPHGVMTDALREAMRTHKEALHDLIECFEERAALMECDGGLPREDAAALSWQALSTLAPRTPERLWT
jgi:hypothetical protein